MAKVNLGNLDPQAWPYHRGRFLVQEHRGGVHAQKWPRKRGTPKSPAHRFLTEQWRYAQRWTLTSEPRQLVTAYFTSARSELLPRDLLTMAAYGTAYQIVMPDGQVLQPTKKSAPAQLKDPPMVGIIYAGTSAVVSAGAWNDVPFDAKGVDTGGWTDLPTNPGALIVPPNVHWIALAGRVTLASALPASSQSIGIGKNGSSNWPWRPVMQFWAPNVMMVTSGPVPVETADSFTLQLFMSANRTVSAGQASWLAAYAL